MKNELITIIVPVYKVEKYLDKCVGSIVNQTYKNLEIILVDDGSPDNCPQMCDEWAKKDKRIKVIHKQNGGLSSARNAGIEIATGDYLMFVDSDDWLELVMIEDLLENSIKEDADISIGNYEKITDGQKLTQETNVKTKVYDKEKVFDCLKENYIQTVTAWGKLFKKSVVEGVQFPNGKIHEDEFTVHRFLHNANKVVYSNKKYYNYLIRNGSITQLKKEDVNNFNTDDIESIQDRIQFLEIKKYPKKLIAYTYSNLFSLYIKRYFHSLNKDFKNAMLKSIKENKVKVKEKGYKKHLTLTVKIKLFLFKYNKLLLKLIVK